MNDIRDKNLTDEVREALSQRGHVIPDSSKLGQQPPPVPEGQLRYQIAVEDTIIGGTASAEYIAAQLRLLADQLEKKEQA
jgi:hypothetical protein